MIKNLKVKFIILSMTTIFILLTVVVVGMNIINYNSVVRDADEVLDFISQNRSKMDNLDNAAQFSEIPFNNLPPHLSPETPYEARFFSISYSDAGKLTNVDISRIASVDSTAAIEYSIEALKHNKTRGFIENYRYVKTDEFNGQRITFLDCSRTLDNFYNFLTTSIFMSLTGFAIVFAVIFIFSGRIISPVAEAYEKQKRFITDAGHEIKTPLTIINANAEILEMEMDEENESLNDIKEQTKRLKVLTEDLVMLSRMEETSRNISKIDFPLSDIVAEVIKEFDLQAIKKERAFIYDIEPLLTFNGNDKNIRHLVYILLDNAFKYSPENGTVKVKLYKANRTISLSVYNTTETDINPEQLKYVFDRFYRTDSSRNSATGGYGIGLSIAKAIVDNHDGDIQAFTNHEKSFQIMITFHI